jgi:hypothetical protein
VNLHNPYDQIPHPSVMAKKFEFPFDMLKVKDEEKTFSPLNNKYQDNLKIKNNPRIPEDEG